jgi:diguanylate cyclase (GGDEF)-like protein/PAS domain S-box-containing protein
MAHSIPSRGGPLGTTDQVPQSSPDESVQPLDALRLREVIDRLTPSVFVGLLSVEGNLIHANRAALDAIGARLDDVVGKPFETTPWWKFSDTAAHRLRSAIKDAARGVASRFDVLVENREGRILTMDFSLLPLHGADGGVEYLIPSARDVSERKAAEQRILYLASHDDLTGLPNRNAFCERLRQAIAHSDLHGHRLAVLLINLDRFGLINDALGHGGGDEVLKAVANRLAGCARETDTLARLDGDEFAFVLSGDHADMSRIADEAQRVADAFAQPVLVGGREVYLTSSIGGVARADSSVTEDRLLKNACSALNVAKSRGGNIAHFYSLATAPHDSERLDLESGLRGALRRDELLLHYQPQIDLRTGTIVGAEALMRWRRPDRGMISPARFIPIAEQTGLIVPLGIEERARRNEMSVRRGSTNRSCERQPFGPTIAATRYYSAG